MMSNIVNIPEVINMLKSDAIVSASNSLGITCNKMCDIFSILLGDCYNEWNLANNILKFIKQLNFTDTQVGEIEYTIDDVANHIVPKYYNLSIDDVLIDAYKKYYNIKKSKGAAIIRLIRNIEDQNCLVCCNNFGVDKCIIFRCCSNIICVPCCIQGCKFTKVNNIISGTCIKCRSVVYNKDLIVLSKNFDLEQIVKENIEYADLKINSITKNDIIINIIHNNPVNREPTTLAINNILNGLKKLPQPDNNQRKYVIYSNYEEASIKLHNSLISANIKAVILNKHVDDKLTQFKAGIVNVIIIDKKQAAGLDLYYATDLIFIQLPSDPEYEKQIIGRLQRYGREYEATVHILEYQSISDI
jgi:hypothetical protein